MMQLDLFRSECAASQLMAVALCHRGNYSLNEVHVGRSHRHFCSEPLSTFGLP